MNLGRWLLVACFSSVKNNNVLGAHLFPSFTYQKNPFATPRTVLLRSKKSLCNKNLVMKERRARDVRRHASKSEEMEIEGLQEEEWDDIHEHVDIPSAGASKTRAAATCAMEEDASIL